MGKWWLEVWGPQLLVRWPKNWSLNSQKSCSWKFFWWCLIIVRPRFRSNIHSLRLFIIENIIFRSKQDVPNNYTTASFKYSNKRMTKILLLEYFNEFFCVFLWYILIGPNNILNSQLYIFEILTTSSLEIDVFLDLCHWLYLEKKNKWGN